MPTPIWTNHAKERLKDRKIELDAANWTFSAPDTVKPGKQPHTSEYKKKFGDHTITLIAKPNEKEELVILSAWIDPPIEGTNDHKKRERYKRYRHAPGWLKLIYIVRDQLGF